MNLYHCLIELRSEAKALAFACAVENWMTHLQERHLIVQWRLLRRKLGLASGAHTDFILEIEIASLAHIDQIFCTLSQSDGQSERHYDHLHQMIGTMFVGLYRPYPDPENRERIALI
ncbi:MAG: hypothetical protein NTX73_06850 [Rhodobacterales bacterium]|nr:hypothetical protein [Rhodobacterales bacterium]